jgi:hypothetical protein
MQILRKVFLCSALAGMEAFSMESENPISYNSSNLSFSSPAFGVILFDTSKTRRIIFPNNQVTQEGYYCTSLAYSRKEHIGDLQLKKFKDGPLHYLCLDPEEQYNDLYQELKELNRNLFCQKEEATKTQLLALSKPPTCTKSSLEDLASRLKKCETVVITFGAGISSGYVPTLLDFFNKINMEKIPSQDMATDESMKNFIIDLFSKKKTLEVIQREWSKIAWCNHETTPAHAALKSLIESLRAKGKDVFVYTDNIDGIHKRMNIELSEGFIKEKEVTEIRYPPMEKLREREVVVLACGQSFDFHGILSTLQTRGKFASEISFFALNTNLNSIGAYEGLDVDEFNMEKEQDISCFPIKYLDMQCIQGSLHDTLPALLSMMN